MLYSVHGIVTGACRHARHLSPETAQRCLDRYNKTIGQISDRQVWRLVGGFRLALQESDKRRIDQMYDYCG